MDFRKGMEYPYQNTNSLNTLYFKKERLPKCKFYATVGNSTAELGAWAPETKAGGDAHSGNTSSCEGMASGLTTKE